MRRNFMDRLRPIRRVLRGIEAAQVRWFGRSLLSTLFRTPALVLETVGRKSGQRRQTALAYHRLRDGDLVIVGGAGGQRRVPDWVANVRADPDVHVVVDRVRRPMTAVELVGDGRATVWNEIRQVWPQIVTCQARAGRPVPVFRLAAVYANWLVGVRAGLRLRLRGTTDALDVSIARGGEFVRRKVEAGEPGFVQMWAGMGGMERFDRRRRWWATARASFSAAMR